MVYVSALWIGFDLLIAVRSQMTKILTKKEFIVWATAALTVAGVSIYSDREDAALMSSLKQEVDTVVAILSPKTNVPVTAGGEAVARAAAAQIDALNKRVAAVENREWPILKSPAIERLAHDLDGKGIHKIEIHPCGTRDCDLFADGLRKALSKANWSQIPIPPYPLMWKSIPGIVISMYGDDAGGAALRDAMKDTLNIDVPTLRYSADAEGPRVKLTIGSKPLDLSISQAK
jgi:hypothetical protein